VDEPLPDGSYPYLAGEQLFESTCRNCHNPYEKQGRTASQIQSAIAGPVGTRIPTMAGISLTSTEIQQIADYLQNPR
jgi:hypothetical protein